MASLDHSEFKENIKVTLEMFPFDDGIMNKG